MRPWGLIFEAWGVIFDALGLIFEAWGVTFEALGIIFGPGKGKVGSGMRVPWSWAGFGGHFGGSGGSLGRLLDLKSDLGTSKVRDLSSAARERAICCFPKEIHRLEGPKSTFAT